MFYFTSYFSAQLPSNCELLNVKSQEINCCHNGTFSSSKQTKDNPPSHETWIYDSFKNLVRSIIGKDFFPFISCNVQLVLVTHHLCTYFNNITISPQIYATKTTKKSLQPCLKQNKQKISLP